MTYKQKSYLITYEATVKRTRQRVLKEKVAHGENELKRLIERLKQQGYKITDHWIIN